MLLPIFRSHLHLATAVLIVAIHICSSIQQFDRPDPAPDLSTPRRRPSQQGDRLETPLNVSTPRRRPSQQGDRQRTSLDSSTPRRRPSQQGEPPRRSSNHSTSHPPTDPALLWSAFNNQSQLPFPLPAPSLDEASGVQCIHVPYPPFSKLSTQILHAVTFVHPGPPPEVQPYAAYGQAPYWFLNNGNGWEVRIIPEVGLSYNNLVRWWPTLQQSVIRITVQCVDKAGMGGRQRFVWRYSTEFMNPDTRIEVQVWRGATQVPVKKPQNFCVIC